MSILKRAIGFCILVLLSFISCLDSPSEYLRKGNCVLIQGDDFEYLIGISAGGIVHFNFSDNRVNGDSIYAPVEALNYLPLKVVKNKEHLIISSKEAKVVVNLRDYSLQFSDEEGGALFNFLGPWEWNQDTLAFSASYGDASIYGMGFRALPTNRSGNQMEAYNQPRYGYGEGESNLNYSVPMWTSSEKYMVLVDDPSRAKYDFGKSEQGVLQYKSLGGNSSIYYWPGKNYKDLFQKMIGLMGRQPLPPIWTFGNLQSRFGYRNQEQASALLEKSLSGGIPVDAVVLDLYWFGEELEDGRMGNLSWDKQNWPEPKRMIEEFKKEGVHTVLITEPFFTLKSDNFSLLDSLGFLVKDGEGNSGIISDFYFGAAGLLDITKAAAADWMWERYKALKQYGIDGWWVDLGEPERNPSFLLHSAGSADKIHGVYSHIWSKRMKEGFDKDFPNERFFYLARAGFAGTHRYGILPWSGDVGRNWSGFRAQLPVMMGMGLSGLAYMHSDAGGFTYTDQADTELYIRWLQMACYSPIFRPHADESLPSELVLWPLEVRDKILPHLKMRYKLLPYHYAMARQVYELGYPMVRPLFLEFPNASDNLDRQYMWGSSILVAPVMEPGIDSMEVFFPEGDWYDLFTGDKVKGNNAAVKLDVSDFHMPLYQKGGTILPLWHGKGNVANYRPDTLFYQYFYSKEKSFQEIYFDDGVSREYENTLKYQKLQIHIEPIEEGVVFLLTRKGYKGSVEWGMGMGIFELSHLPFSVKKVFIEGREIEFQTIANSGIRLAFDTQNAKEIRVLF